MEEFLGDVRPALLGLRPPRRRRSAGRRRSIRSASPICIRDVQYAIEAGDASSRRGLSACCSGPAPSAGGAPQLADATLQAYARQPRAPARRSPAPERPATEAGCKLQTVIGKVPQPPVRLRHQPRPPADQQRLRAGAAPLRRLPQGDQLLPLGMGRRPLRRHQVGHRDRATTRHRRPRRHPPHPRRRPLPTTVACPAIRGRPATQDARIAEVRGRSMARRAARQDGQQRPPEGDAARHPAADLAPCSWCPAR